MADLETYEKSSFSTVAPNANLVTYEGNETVFVGTPEDGIESTVRFISQGEVLQSVVVKDGETPVYTGDTPTKQGDAQYSWTFTGWYPAVGPVYANTDYYAQFQSSVNLYDVSIGVNDSIYGSVAPTSIEDVPYGTLIETGVEPNKLQIGDTEITATPNEGCVFNEWTTSGGGRRDRGELPGSVTGNLSLVANFMRVYTINFGVNDPDYGSVSTSSMGMVPEGAIVTVNGNVVTIGDRSVTATPNAGYEFVRWEDSDGNPLPPSIGQQYTIVAVFQQSINYFTLTANTGGSTVQLTKEGSPAAISLEKSSDGVNWSSYTIDEVITLTNPGDKLLLRNANTSGNSFSDGGAHYYYFVMTGSIAASGDITFLVTKNGGKASLPSWCFFDLFKECTALTSCPELPSTSLGSAAYQMMFYGCTGITECPVLPATTLASSCYRYMFRGCSNLVTVPALYATNFPGDCLECMYEGCSKIYFYAAATADDTNEYRIPMTGTGTGSDNMMLYGSGMGHSVYPSAYNTTYYTRNTIVGIQE